MENSLPKDLKEQDEFWRGIFSEYCPKCPDTCCDATRLLIKLRPEDDESLFLDNCVPVYHWKDLDQSSFKKWLVEDSNNIYSKAGKIVAHGAIIEIPESCFETVISSIDCLNPKLMRIVYSDKYCPLYEQSTQKCKVHEDYRRPYACRYHPLRYPHELQGEPENLLLNENCYLAQTENFRKIKKRFNRAFPESRLDLISHGF